MPRIKFQLFPKQDEIVIDKVDENDEVIGRIDKSNIYRENASFRTSHIFVFNSKGEILLQKLASSKNRYPGRWGSSMAGYVLSGETYEDAASRKLKNELGVKLGDVDLKQVGKTAMEEDGRKKFVSLFKASYDGEFDPDQNEIDEVKFFALGEVEKMIEKNPENFTPNFIHVLNFYKENK